MANPELKIVISGNADKFRKELNRIESDVSNTTDKITKVNYKKMAVAFAALTASVGTALKQFAQYETALVAAGRTTGLAGAELDDFAKKIDDISSRLNTPREQLLKITEVAGTLGIQGADNLAKFTETMAKFDVASATLKGEAAANSIARIIGLTGGGVDKVENFASEIAYLADNFKSTEAETVAIAEELSRLNAKIPLSTENTIALAAAFADLGITPEIARTGMSKFADALDGALRDGGDKLKIFTTLTGMTREELKETFQKSPEKVFTAFSQGLGQAGSEASFIIKQLGLDQDRLSGLFLASAQKSDVLTKAINEGNDAAEKNTKLNEEVAKVLDTTQSKWDGVKVAVGKVTAEIGEKLSPVAKDVFEGMEKIFNILYQQLDKDIPNALKTFGNLFDQIFTAISIKLNEWMRDIRFGFGQIQISALKLLGSIPGVDTTASVNLTTDVMAKDYSDSTESIYKKQSKLNALFKEFEELHTKSVADESAKRDEIRNIETEKELALKRELEAKKKEIQDLLDEEKTKADEEKRQADLELKQEQFEEDMELLQERLDLAAAAKDTALQYELMLEQNALAEKAKLLGLETDQKKKAQAAMVALVKARANAEMTLHKAMEDSVFATLNNIVGHNKAAQAAIFLIQKAMAISRVIVEGEEAALLAYGSQFVLGDPTSQARAIAAYAAAKATARLTAATIAVSAVPELVGMVGKAQQGGIVPGFGSGDRVPMMLEPGELVVPKQIRPTFEEYMQSKGGGGTQGVQVMIGLDENASRVLTVKQREDSKLGIQS